MNTGMGYVILSVLLVLAVIFLFSYLYQLYLKKAKVLDKVGLGISILESLAVLFIGGFIGNFLFYLFAMFFHSGSIMYFYWLIKIVIGALVLYGLLYSVLYFIHNIDKKIASKVASNTVGTYMLLMIIIGFFLGGFIAVIISGI